MHFSAIFIIITFQLIIVVNGVNLINFFGKLFGLDSVTKSSELSSSREADTAKNSNATLDDDDDNVDQDSSGGKDCPSYQVIADLIPWGNRAEKCCLDKSSPPKRKNICYTNKKGTPWQNLPRLPLCPAEISPEFYIFTPEDETKLVKNNNSNNASQSIDYANLNQSAQLVNLTKGRQFFVIVHGFQTKSWDKNWMFSMKDVLLELGHNAMVVKWTKGSNVDDYSKAAANTRTTGTVIANVLDVLLAMGKIDLDHLTLIGFSLGAHVCGYVGALFNGTIPRILALDPAGPLFVCQDKASRLDPSDAKFVQAIHTNGDSFLDGGLGTPQRMGHVDFYPNGGLTQPGCPRSFVNKVAKKLTTFRFSNLDVSCSHSKAPLIAIELIKKSLRQRSSKTVCGFQTFVCSNAKDWQWGRCFKPCIHPGTNSEDCPVPGLELLFAPPKTFKQRYYFDTLNQSDYLKPGDFCGRQHLLTIASSNGAKGSVKVRLFDEKFGWSNRSIFQRQNHKLKKLVDRSEVITTVWNISNISKIELLYVRYTALLRANGPVWFTLTNLTVQEASGEMPYVLMLQANSKLCTTKKQYCAQRPFSEEQDMVYCNISMFKENDAINSSDCCPRKACDCKFELIKEMYFCK